MSLQDQLIIRPIHPDDAEDHFANISHPLVAENLMQLPSLEFSATQSWIQEPRPGSYRLVAERNGRVVGAVTISQPQNPRQYHVGKMGLFVHPDYWGQGVGTALVEAAIDLADNWLNLFRFELGVYTHNEAAVYLYEKLGFEIEGTKRQFVFGGGRYLDCYIMARLRHAEWYAVQSPSPAPTRPLPQRQPANAVIRTPRYPDDVEDLYAMYRQPAVGRTTMQLPSQEIYRTRNRLKEAAPNVYRYVAEVDGRVVGNAALVQSQYPRSRHTATLGMAVHPDYWGQGIGSQLLDALMNLADNWLQLTRVELEVNEDNPAGVRLYKKFGFEVEGTKRMHAFGDGRMADSYFMARIRNQ